MPETYTVQLPDGRTISKTLPDGLSDAQIRDAFAQDAAMLQQSQVVRQGMFGGNPHARAINALYGNLEAPPDTLASRGTDTIRNALAGLGVDERYAQHVADRAFGFLNDLTPVGDAVSLDDARAAWGRGDYLAAGGNALLAALGSVPGMGDAAAGTAKAIIAPLFHGSPHKFDKFSLDKIGTGEGAQAYGHGLYFAESPDVAASYQHQLAVRNADFTFKGQPLKESREWWGAQDALEASGDWRQRKALDQAYSWARQGYDQESAMRLIRNEFRNDPKMQDAISRLENNLTYTPGTGHLYEVQLDANPEDFLDWDRPLAQQPDAIRSAYADAAIPARSSDPLLAELVGQGPVPHDYLGLFPNSSGAQAYNTLAERAMSPNAVGLVAEYNAQRLAAERLRQAGVPGIRYLDQGSRRTGDGTSNYVVFDDGIIDILNRR